MKALIIEDELPAARRLERMLTNFEVEILSVLTSVKSAVTWLKNNPKPDVILLDIHLSDGLCFEIFKEVNVSSKIIFTTAYSSYSIKAFDYDSVSYLLKPIQKKQLEIALNKAKKIIYVQEDLERLQHFFTCFETRQYKDTFTVKVGAKIKIIKEKEISCFYSFDNATYIKINQHQYVYNQSLTFLESQLNPKLFFRVNRTFIVHLNAIKDIIAYSNSRLKLLLHSYNETEIVISRERVKDFKRWIE